MWRSAHQLTAAQAMAVFEQLSYRHQLLPQQLFVLGHGENFPVASNATAAGQSRNRRVEIVIYPEVVGQRNPG
jgi:flagellar motor protein MotB